MKKKIITALAICLALMTAGGCGARVSEPRVRRFYTYFDTVSALYCYGNVSQGEFDRVADEVEGILSEYHSYFDIYHRHGGLVNLCDLNEAAGGEWVKVDSELFDFLRFAVDMYGITEGRTNVMMGAVLSMWHDCRAAASADPENASLPDMALLIEADRHTDISLLELDAENTAARITDPLASIDVGAIGKGYAAERAAEYLKTVEGGESYVLDLGGNLRFVGSKPDGSPYRTAVTDPFDTKGQPAALLELADISCVTSGNYERNFTVDGRSYHHIIDPDTLMPGGYFASVTVVTEDSGMADGLSTALFCLSYEEGMELYSKRGDFEALWITPEGERLVTPGLELAE